MGMFNYIKSYSKSYFLSLGIALCFLSCGKQKLEIEVLGHQKLSNDRLNAIHFIDEQNGFIAAGKKYSNGVLFVTSDGGLNWDSIGLNADKLLRDIKFLSSDNGFVCGDQSRFFKTEDGGDNWNQIQVQTQPIWTNLHAFDFDVDSKIIGVGGEGFGFGMQVISKDGFQTWEYEALDFELVDIQFISSETAIAVGYGVIVKTEDLGANWQIADVEGDFFTSLYFIDEQTGYVVGDQGSILKSEDAGNSWISLRSANNLIQERQHFQTVKFAGLNEGYIAGDNGVVWRSLDQGVNWEKIQIETKADFKDLVILNDKIILVGDDGNLTILKR